MSKGATTRFQKGQSGNPSGRPSRRRPNISAFDIVFDRTLTVLQNGKERELTVDEALQLQTYQAALTGSRMAIRSILKMIEKRELALEKLSPAPTLTPRHEIEHDSDNADAAMALLGIAAYGEAPPGGGLATRPFKLQTWAAQAGISRPGRIEYSDKDIDEIKCVTLDADALKWPRRRRA